MALCAVALGRHVAALCAVDVGSLLLLLFPVVVVCYIDKGQASTALMHSQAEHRRPDGLTTKPLCTFAGSRAAISLALLLRGQRPGLVGMTP